MFLPILAHCCSKALCISISRWKKSDWGTLKCQIIKTRVWMKYVQKRPERQIFLKTCRCFWRVNHTEPLDGRMQQDPVWMDDMSLIYCQPLTSNVSFNFLSHRDTDCTTPMLRIIAQFRRKRKTTMKTTTANQSAGWYQLLRSDSCIRKHLRALARRRQRHREAHSNRAADENNTSTPNQMSWWCSVSKRHTCQ